MPRSQKNDNFIDKTFTIVADILLRIIPTTQREKEAFTYYRDGVTRVRLQNVFDNKFYSKIVTKTYA